MQIMYISSLIRQNEENLLQIQMKDILENWKLLFYEQIQLLAH